MLKGLSRSHHSRRRMPSKQWASDDCGHCDDGLASLWEEWKPRSLCQSRWLSRTNVVVRQKEESRKRSGSGLEVGWLDGVRGARARVRGSGGGIAEAVQRWCR